jgi:hypothetical protein
MSSPEPVHIFHVYRNDGTPLFLHPFGGKRRIVDILEGRSVDGLYGKEPRVESLTMFRNELYRIIERDVKEWISEVRFLPRFLMAAAVFVLAYLFLALVVRDPLPIIDEIAIALGGAIVTYFVVGRRYLRSGAAAKRRISLRTKVDNIVFHESELAEDFETLLAKTEEADADELLFSLSDPTDSEGLAGYYGQDNEALKQLIGYLDNYFSGKDYRRQERRLLKAGAPIDDRERSAIKRWVSTKDVDLPLFAVYLSIKRQAARTS